MEVQLIDLGLGEEQPTASPATGSSKQVTRTASVKEDLVQRTEQVEDDTAAQGTDGQDPW